MQVRGFQVAPAELEGCILDHPLVGDVCVVGIPHAYSGEVPLAFVVLTKDGMNTGERDGSFATVKASIRKVFSLLHPRNLAILISFIARCGK